MRLPHPQMIQCEIHVLNFFLVFEPSLLSLCKSRDSFISSDMHFKLAQIFSPPHVRHIKRMTCAHLYIWKLNGAHSSKKKKEEPSLCCALIETCSGHRSRLTALLIHSTPVCYSAGRHTRLTFLSLPLFLPLTPYLLSPSPPPIIHLSQGVTVAPCAHCLMLF